MSRLEGWDYVSLSVVVTLSSAIGVYHIYTTRRAKDTSRFLVSTNDLGVAPLTLSVMATFVNAVGIMGFSAEFYVNGLSVSAIFLASAISIVINSGLFLPVFYTLKKNTIFEYLELRFTKQMRLCTSCLLLLQMLLLSSCVIYAPALALNQVTGIHIWASILSIGIFGIIYTSFGGFKAVVWADATQCVALICVLVLIVVKGTIDVGGLNTIWERLKIGKRDEIFIWSSSPNSQYSFWTLVIGGTCNMLPLFALNQSLTQRYLSTESLAKSRLVCVLGTVGVMICHVLQGFSGILMYAYYYNCDPISDGRIEVFDQVMALFAIDILAIYQGLAGVFVAGLMCATLSTISSCLNTMAAITLSDFLKDFKFSDETFIRISRILVVVYGVLFIALVTVTENMGGLLKALFGITGITGGPLLTLFTLGMLFPWVNSKGAAAGFICSTVFPVWAWVGNMVTAPPLPHAPFSTYGCSNYTALNSAVSNHAIREESILQQFYALPPFWYASWSFVTGVIVAVLVSKLTGFQNPYEVDQNLLFPFVSKYLCKQSANIETNNGIKEEQNTETILEMKLITSSTTT